MSLKYHLFTVALLSLSCFQTTSGSPSPPGFLLGLSKRDSLSGCSAVAPPSFESVNKKILKRRHELLQKRDPISVDVHFHVIHTDNTVAGGKIPATRLAAQFSVIQSQIATLGFSLTLQSTTYTQNTDFFNANGNYDNIISTLRTGGYEDLNIFFVGGGGIGGGRATFPIETPTARQIEIDGVLVHHLTTPGTQDEVSAPPGWNLGGWTQGKVAVHEVGHWLGLYHPFHNLGCLNPENCLEDGDQVCDTNQSELSPYGCPSDPDYDDYYLNSCGWNGITTRDPQENPMTLTDDQCKDDIFTPGQGERARMVWAVTRA